MIRLKKGTYSEPGNSVPGNDFFNEEMSYDLNGNILSLQRNNKGASGMAEQIDNLSYNYTGNRLNSVKENQPNYLGYPEFSENPISYDDNGNMTDQKDKGILEIKYNFLNLADYVKFDQTYVPRFQLIDNNVNTRYTYRADGVKLRKLYTFGSGRANLETTTVTEYLDGFQYEVTAASDRIPVQVLKFVPTAEGYYNFENNKYIYSYTDHLGNTRVSYFNNGSGAAVIQENNYYPFGLKHDAYNGLGGNTAYKYQYNNKELQEESGMYDYGARMYMPELGRWGVIDPLAENMRRFSPYNYGNNNPVFNIDPDGMLSQAFISQINSSPGGTTWTNTGDGFTNNWGGSMGYSGLAFNFRSHTSSSLGSMFGEGGGGGSTTFGETPQYQAIMALFGQTEYFKGIDFSKFSNLDLTPKRKYLKDQANAYFGAIESVTQYQLDHSNWVDEYQGTMDLLGSMKEYFDSAGDHLGGAGYGTFAIDNLKTIKEVVEKFKNYNPSLASATGFIAGTVGTSLKMEGDRFGQIMDIYKNAEYRYDQLHKTNPELHKGVTVNVNVVIGTNGGGYTNIMIYDISTHRYLSGGKIVHRN